MTAIAPTPSTTARVAESNPDIFYPSEDDEPLAETQEHIWAILTTLSILSQYLSGQQAVVFADQFFYYVEGKPSARIAPDVMVVFDIPVRLYANYKLWEGKQTPAVIFEMTSESTKEKDWGFKKTLYEQLGVQEYWLFDPYGEWIPEQLRGFRLNDTGEYRPIADNCSEVLQLRLQPEGYLIGFYRRDTNEKLLTPDELLAAAQQERERAEQERERADRLAARLRELGLDDVE